MKLTYHKLIRAILAFVLGSAFCWLAAYLVSKDTWPEYVTRTQLMVSNRSFSSQGLGQIKDLTRVHTVERTNLETMLTSSSVIERAQDISQDVDSENILEHLNIKTEAGSSIITIELDSFEEELSKKILSRMLALVNEIQVERQLEETKNLVLKLKKKELDLEKEIEASNQSLFRYLKSRKHVFFRPDAHQSLIAQLTNQYYVDTLTSKRRSAQLEMWMKNVSSMDYLPTNVSGALDRERFSIIQNLSKAELDEASALVQYGSESKETVEARKRKVLLEKQLRAFKNAQKRVVQFEMDSEKNRMQILEKLDKELESYFWETSLLHDPEYSRWNLKIDNLSQNYEECQKRRVELELYQGLIAANFQVIFEPALVSGIDRKRISILLFASAVVGGFIFAVAALLISKK